MSFEVSMLRKALMTAVAVAVVGMSAQVSPGWAQTAPEWRAVAPENLLVIDTTKGRVLVEMSDVAAPNHVRRIRELVGRRFYDGIKWHRVIAGFMAQTGDPLGTGEGGSDLPDVAAEFNFRRDRSVPVGMVTTTGGASGYVGSLPVATQPDAQMMITADGKAPAVGLFCTGVLGMARATSPDSANSQFFLMTGDRHSLDGKYTAFGHVVSGQDVVGSLQVGDDNNEGKVANPDIMTRVRLASDLPEAERPVVRVLDPHSARFAQLVEAGRAAHGSALTVCDIDLPTEVTNGG